MNTLSAKKLIFRSLATSVIVFMIAVFGFVAFVHAALPTPQATSPVSSQSETSGTYSVSDVQISLNNTQKAEYVMYQFDPAKNSWIISSSAIGLSWTPVSNDLSTYYQKMKDQGWTGTFSYSDVNNYEIMTNNLKNKSENDGLAYLLTEIKTDATEDLSYIQAGRNITGREIKLNPNDYSIVNGKLQVGSGGGGTASPTTGTGTTQPNVIDDTGGGDLSLAGGINISKPSSVKIGSLNTAYNTIFNIVIVTSGTVFIFMLLIGGIQYLTSEGIEENITKAKKLLINATVGIIIVTTAWAVGTYVLGKLNFGKSSQGTTTSPQTIPISSGLPTPLEDPAIKHTLTPNPPAPGE